MKTSVKIISTTLVCSFGFMAHYLYNKNENPGTEVFKRTSTPNLSRAVSPIEVTPLKKDAPQSVSETAPLKAKFALYQKLGEKVLRTSEETQSYEAILADRELIKDSRDFLLNSNSNKDLKEDQSQRIDRVNFLIDSLRKKGNPNIKDVQEALEKVVLEAKVDPSWPEHMRRARVGDRVELFMALSEQDPQRAKELIDATSGDESTHRILLYASRFYHQQKANGVIQ